MPFLLDNLVIKGPTSYFAYIYTLFLHPYNIFYCAVQVDGDDLQNYDDEKEDTDNIDIIEDFGSKTCLDPLISKENLEQEREGEVGLKDQQIEDVIRSTHQADQNVVLLVMSENTRKRARLDIGEDNLMDKVVDRVKRKNPEDVQGNLQVPSFHPC